MMIGVVGLGLIGGSMAKAINSLQDHSVYGYDIDETIIRKAVLVNAIEEELKPEMIPLCDLIIIALYPKDTVAFVEKYQDDIKEGSVIMDTCGVKKCVCDGIEPIAREKGFWYIGGHPMAGIEHAGFDHAKKALFQNASMILLPMKRTPIEVVDIIKQLVEKIGFTNVEITEADEHDEIIAFTSQLAHVLSSAYIKSPTAAKHRGFSAGSYNDMTRVANLNEDMWTELFLENPDNLANEIDGLIERLHEYSTAIRDNDEARLHDLLKTGRERKTFIDKETF
jgi:prephenate dehydrogenase